MDSLNRRDCLNRADVIGVRILKLHRSTVKAEIHTVYRLFLMWVKPDFPNPMDCKYSIIVYPYNVPAFDGNDSGQNCFIQTLFAQLREEKYLMEDN